ncbi:MAG: 16S rRNA (cytosine(1402)-N(4))-methyltransferase RsmH [Bacteroidales bacterium]|nr:16S rRNA (cytosine(1402)-N(4))-methyltransferase RsmH [Bacteroidales bacterium]
MMIKHQPVLLTQVLDYLAIDPDGIYVDATFGTGGHAFEIYKHLSPKGKVIAFDRDAEVIDQFSNELPQNLFLFHSTFSFIQHFLLYTDTNEIDGLLADLGISSHQVDSPLRGFSYLKDGPLDMRMNPRSKFSAYDVINTYSYQKLTDIFRNYGELSNANQVAELIVNARTVKPIRTTLELVEILKPVMPPKSYSFLSKVFQAIRIEVNQELEELQSLLEQSKTWLKKGGRLVIISYHSIEDRMVKKFFLETETTLQTMDTEYYLYGKKNQATWKILTKKPIRPSESEMQLNPRSRSAKLRAAEKI